MAKSIKSEIRKVNLLTKSIMSLNESREQRIILLKKLINKYSI